VRPGCETSMQYFSFLGGPMWVPQETRRDVLRRTCVFASRTIRRSCCMFWCVRCAKRQSKKIRAQVGPTWVPQEARRDLLCQTCVLASCMIWRSHSLFWCICGAKCRHTIFHARVDPCGSHRNRAGTRYAELVFFAFCAI
jgi:hypothetical protein